MKEYNISPSATTLHGVLDPAIPPCLKIQSGDVLHIETLEADWRISRPDSVTFAAEFFPRDEQRDKGHALCGPVFVEGAMPGDALKIEILDIRTADWGWTSTGIGNRDHLDRLGYQGEEFFRVWDIRDGYCLDQSGMKVPIDPFPGVLAVAPKGNEPVRTHIPGDHGGNLDCRELRPGTVIYLPVSHPGALFSVGDGHAAQGDGESGCTAVECPFREISLRLSAADRIIDSPLAFTKTHVLTFGFDEDLTTASYQALARMRDFLRVKYSLEEKLAMTLCSVCGDLHVTQIVNGIRGVHVMLPLSALEHI